MAVRKQTPEQVRTIKNINLKLSKIEQLLAEIKQSTTLIKIKMGEKSLLSVSDASIMLSISPSTLYQWVSAGKIPFKKKGKTLYFMRSEIMAWIKEGNKKGKHKSKSKSNS